MSFCVYNSIIALCNNERVLIIDINDGTEKTIELPKLETGKKIDHHNNVDIDSYHMITNIAFSNDGNYFFVCTNRKQLCLYNRKSTELLSNRTLARAASRVRFSPNNDIIVADKSGDAYVYSTDVPTKNGVSILGHLSMLLDILITEDEKYILTTDRDEKIRVSMYPNCYNIVSYCLGHNKFVTNISELPHKRDILVSAGGDGTLKLWDYKHGKEILSTNFSERISKEDIDKFNEELQDCHLDEFVNILPVKHLKLSAFTETASLAALSFYRNRTLLIYMINNNSERNFEVTYLQSINLTNEPLECHLQNQDLWILTDSGFETYEFKDNSFLSNDVLHCKLKQLNNMWEILKTTIHKQDLFPILYKRKYDNVQEYLEKKKMRFANITE